MKTILIITALCLLSSMPVSAQQSDADIGKQLDDTGKLYASIDSTIQKSPVRRTY